MVLPPILAHGALGAWDEIIFLSVAAIFVAMMGISWVRSRNAPPPADIPTDFADTKAPFTPQTDSDRFRLE